MKIYEFIDKFGRFYSMLDSFDKRTINARIYGGMEGLLELLVRKLIRVDQIRRRATLYLIASYITRNVSITNYDFQIVIKKAENIPQKEIEEFYKDLTKL